LPIIAVLPEALEEAPGGGGQGGSEKIRRRFDIFVLPDGRASD